MKEFFTSKKFKIILALCALFAGVMLYAALSGQNGVSSAVGAVLSPVQRVSSSISSWVSSRLDMLINAGDYYEENKRLREELARLTAELADYISVKQENEQLREMVGLAGTDTGMEFSEPCTVIGRTANDLFGSFFIDKGAKDGIGEMDPVVTKDGLVGFVTEVQYTYSLVTPIMSNELSIGVFCVRTGETGVSSGSLELAADGVFSVLYLPLDCQLEEGDILVTSGYSGLVPGGLVVGRITSLAKDASGLSNTGYAAPAVDSAGLKKVYVIVDFDGKGEGFEAQE